MASIDPEGFLNDRTAAALMKNGKAVRRNCRWCGEKMSFTGRHYLCSGDPSCDQPPFIPGVNDEPISV